MHFSRKNSNNFGRPSSGTSEKIIWVCHGGYLIFSRIKKKLRNNAVRAVKFTDPQLLLDNISFCPVWQNIYAKPTKIGQNSKNEVVAQKTEGPQAYARYMADLLTFLL